jgi:hypothetical protein
MSAASWLSCIRWCARFGRWRLGLMLWLGVALLAAAQTDMAAAQAPTSERADWAAAGRAPLWSFAWLSDMHLGTAQPEFIAKALRQVDAWTPHFLLITGDNNFLEAAPANRHEPESPGLRRQRFLKQFLHEHLKTPYVLLPGNNWPEDFDKVFGAKQYSFDCGGLHFMVVDADRAYRGTKEMKAHGFRAFNEATWDWIGRDLQRSRRQPVVVAMHEPVCPITFLDARRLRDLLDRYPNVFLVLQGHLHADLEFHRKGTTYLVAPALGRTSAPAMKLVHVYPEGLMVRTAAYTKSGDRFEMTDRCQKIEMAESLRGGLAKPSGPGFAMANYDCVPPHPFVDDPSLAKRGRVDELMENAKDFLLPSK